MMNSTIKFLIGLALVFVLGVLSIHASVLPGSREAAARKAANIAEERLREAGADWAEIEMRGQRLTVSGEAPSEEAAKALVSGLSDNVITGPITITDHSALSARSLPPLADPHIWIAEYQNGAILLSGAVPSQQARDAVFQLAAMRFADKDIDGALDIARGPIAEEDWTTATSLALQALTRLERGAVELNNSRLIVTGEAIDRVRADTIRDFLASAPASITVEQRISLAPVPEPAVEAASFNLPAEEAPPVTETSTDVEAPQTEPEENPREQTETVAAEAAPDAGSAEPQTAAPEPDDDDIEPDEEQAARAIPETPSLSSRRITSSCAGRLTSLGNETRIMFSSAEIDFDAPSRAQLTYLAEVMVDECPNITVTITGHTDSQGSAARNRTLSLYRADAVAAYLRSLGVAPTRLTTFGAGERRPIASNQTAAGREQNRRIEFAFTSVAEQ